MSTKKHPDKTDVMYEIMEVYPIAWLYFLSFIFLTTFAFLNMVIGIVVNVLEDEHSKEREAQDKLDGKITIEDLSRQLNELKTLLVNKELVNKELVNKELVNKELINKELANK
ncbi:MAG: ion transporter [Alteromonadaceae bacterium]|nr:ion transporter [Alteromonadaceae bacterium]